MLRPHLARAYSVHVPTQALLPHNKYYRAGTLGEGSYGSVCVAYDEDGNEWAAKLFAADDNEEEEEEEGAGEEEEEEIDAKQSARGGSSASHGEL